MAGRILRSVRAAVVTALIVLPTAVGLASPGSTSFRITVRASSSGLPLVTSLRCDPPAGTVAQPARACRRLLAAGRGIFAPTPPRTACTLIYGGPQDALVTGTRPRADLLA